MRSFNQALQPSVLLGHNAKTVNWQLWMALLAYMRLCFETLRSDRTPSSSRVLSLLRGLLM